MSPELKDAELLNYSYLNVTMEDAVAVHVIHSFHKLVHVVLDSVLGYVVPSPSNELRKYAMEFVQQIPGSASASVISYLVDVHVHELKYERQSTRWLIIQHLYQLDNVRMRGQTAKSLDLPQVVHLV